MKHTIALPTGHIYISRHEEYEGRGFVTSKGRTRLEVRAQHFLKEGTVRKGSTAAISSQELRAVKSMQAFAMAAGIEDPEDLPDSFKELFSNDSVCDVEAALGVLSRFARYETLFVFTHLEMVEALSVGVCDSLGIACPAFGTINYGSGVHVDVAGRKARFMSI